jgi:putative phosphoesterase
MRIGVVSDTHDNARNVARIVEVLSRARVDRVVHTGDITRPETLAKLAEIGVPLVAVFGNNDVDRDALAAVSRDHRFEIAEPPLELCWEGHAILVLHDPRAMDGALRAEHRLVLHGHNHRRIVERRDERLIFNPGECAGILEGHNAVGVVDLAELEAEVLLF